jgi:hypothetical protein
MKKYLAIILALASSAAVAKVDLDNSFMLSPGMSKQEVLDTMGGKPNDSEFVGSLSEWHFHAELCKGVLFSQCRQLARPLGFYWNPFCEKACR